MQVLYLGQLKNPYRSKNKACRNGNSEFLLRPNGVRSRRERIGVAMYMALVVRKWDSDPCSEKRRCKPYQFVVNYRDDIDWTLKMLWKDDRRIEQEYSPILIAGIILSGSPPSRLGLVVET